jgi:hypothetical protein
MVVFCFVGFQLISAIVLVGYAGEGLKLLGLVKDGECFPRSFPGFDSGNWARFGLMNSQS